MTFPGVADDEHVIPIDLGITWDYGAPMPVLIANDNDTRLVLYLSSLGEGGKNVGVITWVHCLDAWIGGPNDEGRGGHRLQGRGATWFYDAIEVINSSWIKQRDHFWADPTRPMPPRQTPLPHIILGLHDVTYECIAEGFVVETYDATFGAVVMRLIDELGISKWT